MLLALSLGLIAPRGRAETLEVASPNGAQTLRLDVGADLRLSIHRGGTVVLQPSRVALTVGRPPWEVLGQNAQIVARARSSRDETYASVMYAKRQKVRDHYHQLEVTFDGGFGLILRAYDDGVAFRWKTARPGELTVRSEQLALRFPGNPQAYVQIAHRADEGKAGAPDGFHFNYESTYTVGALRDFRDQQRAVLPVLVVPEQGPKVLITESDLIDYPGLWFTGSAGTAPELDATFPAYPLEETIAPGEFPQAVVTRRADFIARTAGTREFPWRVFALADRDTDLVASDIVHRLGGETPAADWSWLKPGKSQSEWVQDNRLTGVPFRAGYNFETYRYYADFDARFRTGYLFCDAGWSDVSDPLKTTPAMRVPELIAYAHARGLGVVLWTSSVPMETRTAEILDAFQRWGVAGVMVDFMDRDDQKMVNFYERVAREAAQRKMFVNFHGAYKPTGLERRYPNVFTREAVKASEYFKWSDELTPEFEVTVPFIRMVAGPLDYEPGFMRNAQRADFRAISAAPMSMGTRMHQAALYLVYESPYAKLAGNVSDYVKEPEFTAFLASIPTVWKETRVLDGKVSDYILIAREAPNGDVYVGALTDWTPRELTLDLGFLGEGSFEALIYADGINADRTGTDFVRETRSVAREDRLTLKLAPGGGWVGKFAHAQPPAVAGKP